MRVVLRLGFRLRGEGLMGIGLLVFVLRGLERQREEDQRRSNGLKMDIGHEAQMSKQKWFKDKE